MQGLRRLTSRWWEAHYGGVLARELALLAFMLWLYKYVRYIARDQTEAAFENARRILDWENFLGLDTELFLQKLVLPYDGLLVAMNRYYVSVHFIGTVVFLLWAFVRSLREYQLLRRVLVAVTLSALAIHVAFPLAPPRMLDSLGFVDTMARWGPNPYDSEAVESFANQFAAMPSLHVGWSLIVAYGVIRISRSRFRHLIVIHPAVTSLAVVLTANHYWLDGIVAAALVAGAVYWLGRRHEIDLTEPEPEAEPPARQLQLA